MRENLKQLVLGAVILLAPTAMLTAQARLQHAPQSGLSVVRAVTPAYPSIALAAGATGSVIIEIQIDAAGKVTGASVIQGIGLLGKAAENSARQWVFARAEKSVRRTAKLSFTFMLMSRDAPMEQTTAVFLPPFGVEVRGRKPLVENIVTPNSRSSRKTVRQH